MNVVFDFGGVVFRWEPEAIIAGAFADPAAREVVRSEIFRHNDWLELDRGTLSLPDAISRGAARTGLPESEIAGLLDRVPFALTPIPGTVDLLHRVKAKGRPLYYLSNMHVASIEHLQAVSPFWHLFDGGVVSCRIHSIKPEPGIYRRLLDACRLNPRETVFIDDTQVNLDAAEAFGIRTIRFENPAQCEAGLRALDCL